MAQIGSSASACAIRFACQRPVSLSGMSSWPWMRVATFQAVSPWRMAMMRVAFMGAGNLSEVVSRVLFFSGDPHYLHTGRCKRRVGGGEVLGVECLVAVRVRHAGGA